MRAVILALTCAFLETVVAQRTPTIDFISPEKIGDIGEIVYLFCSTHDAQDKPVLWVKVNRENPHKQVILSSGEELLIRDNRFAIRLFGSSYVLQIKDMQETDVGFYQCRIQLSVNDLISAEVELKVRKPRKPPIISDNSTESLVIYGQGPPIILKCYASGFPQPRISWHRENNTILPTGRPIFGLDVMRITAIKKTDRGTYYCVWNNDVGRRARHNINVEVESAS